MSKLKMKYIVNIKIVSWSKTTFKNICFIYTLELFSLFQLGRKISNQNFPKNKNSNSKTALMDGSSCKIEGTS